MFTKYRLYLTTIGICVAIATVLLVAATFLPEPSASATLLNLSGGGALGIALIAAYHGISYYRYTRDDDASDGGQM